MATIKTRRQANGAIRYTAIVRRRARIPMQAVVEFALNSARRE
jgi:hypothetical protein